MSRRKNKKLTSIGCFILDKSGSMSSLKPNVLSGFKEYVNTMKKKDVDSKFFLTLFDSESIERPYEGTPLKQVEPLTEKTYQPFGMTPLYDAVVSTIKRMELVAGDLPDTAISVVIMTDGLENDSKEYTEKDLSQLIRRLSDKNWTFAYMGANQDSWATAAKFGIQQNNVLNWDSNLRGTQKAFHTLAMSSANYMDQMVAAAATGAELKTSDFFANKK